MEGFVAVGLYVSPLVVHRIPSGTENMSPVGMKVLGRHCFLAFRIARKKNPRS